MRGDEPPTGELVSVLERFWSEARNDPQGSLRRYFDLPPQWASEEVLARVSGKLLKVLPDPARHELVDSRVEGGEGRLYFLARRRHPTHFSLVPVRFRRSVAGWKIQSGIMMTSLPRQASPARERALAERRVQSEEPDGRGGLHFVSPTPHVPALAAIPLNDLDPEAFTVLEHMGPGALMNEFLTPAVRVAMMLSAKSDLPTQLLAVRMLVEHWVEDPTFVRTTQRLVLRTAALWYGNPVARALPSAANDWFGLWLLPDANPPAWVPLGADEVLPSPPWSKAFDAVRNEWGSLTFRLMELDWD